MDETHDMIAGFLGMEKSDICTNLIVYYGMMSIGGLLMYLGIATCSFLYFFIYKKERYYPHTIKESELWKQVYHEIYIACFSIPLIAVPMLPAAVLSHRGYSKVYKNVSDYGWGYFFLSIFLFFGFTDMLVYWAHRGLHHPLIYKNIHKLHHTYKWTTPYSSHAFHPLDGFGQGVPYFIAIYLFPLHNKLFSILFVLVNLWTISIHDQVDFGSKVLNSTGHHTIHHVEFNYNYGQYTTLWDRIGGTYKPAVKTHEYPHSIKEIILPEMHNKVKEV